MKKIISLILSIALLATLMPTVFVSAADGDEVMLLPVTADTPLVAEDNYMGTGAKANNYNGGTLSSYYIRNRSSSVTYGLHRVDLTGLSTKLINKAVTKVEFCEYVVGTLPSDIPNYRDTASTKHANKLVSVYPVSSDWDENTVTLKKWNEANHELTFSTDGYGVIATSTTPSTTTCTFPAVTSAGTPELVTMDVTGAFQQAMAAGIDENSSFSFLSVLPTGTGYGWINVAAREYSDEDYRPYIKVTISDIPPATVVTEYIPVKVGDAFSIALTENINSAEVKVNNMDVSSADISLSGKKFTLNNAFAASGTYTVDVKLTTDSDSVHTKSYTFSISDNSTLLTRNVYITKDTILTGRNLLYGGTEYVGYEEKEYLATRNNSSDVQRKNFILLETTFDGLDTPQNKLISKAELVMHKIFWDDRSNVCNGNGVTDTTGITVDDYYLRCDDGLASKTVSFYSATKGWNENITARQWADAKNTPQLDTETGFVDNNYIKAGDEITSYPAVAFNESATLTYDITNIFRASLGSQSISDSNTVAFMGFQDNFANGVCYASSEHRNREWRPYIKLTFDDIPDLTETSVTLPVKPSDSFSLELSNSIDTASVKVNSESVDSSSITKNANVLTFDYNYTPFTDYKVAVNVTDIFGKTFSKEYKFTTSYNVESGSLSGLGAYHTTRESTTSFTTKKYGYTYPEDSEHYLSSSLVLFNLPLPEVTEGYLDSYVVNIKVDYPSKDNVKYMRLYSYDLPADKAVTSLVWTDLQNERNDESRLDRLTYLGDKTYALDATAFANEALAAGKSSIWIIADSVGDGSTSYFPASATYAINTAPSIDVSSADTSIDVSGAFLKDVKVKLITRFNASVEDNMHLYDENGVVVENVPFAYNFYNGEFYLSQPFALKENAKYTLKLEGKLEDVYSNEKTLDIEIASFTTGYDFVNHGIKILAADAAYDNDSFAAHTPLTSTEKGANIRAYWRVDNNAITEKALIIAIAAYNDDNELVGVQFSSFTSNDEESKVYRTIDITVPETAATIKAFGWDGTSQANIADLVAIPVQ